MINFTHYKAGVLIAAGLTVGGVLWFERSDNFLRGEDYAAVLAAVNEVLTATAPITFGFVEKKVGYFADKSDLMYEKPFLEQATSENYNRSINRVICFVNGFPTNKIINIASADINLVKGSTSSGTTTWSLENSGVVESDLLCSADDTNKSVVAWYFYRDATNQTSTALSGFANWWDYIGLSDTKELVINSKFLLRSELDEVRTLITNLRQTVVLLPASELDYDYSRTAFYSKPLTNTAWTVGYAKDTTDWLAYTYEDGLDYLNSGIGVGSFDRFEYYTNIWHGGWSGHLASWRMTVNIYGRINRYWKNGGWTIAYQQSEIRAEVPGQVQHTEAYGCYFTYPSDFAYTNNYVGRLRVYAICTARPCTRLTLGYDDNYVTLDQSQPNFYEDKLAGVIDDVCRLKDGLPSSVDGDAQILSPVNDLNQYSTIIAVKVADLENPIIRPTFKLGSYASQVYNLVSLENFQKAEHETEELIPEDEWNQTYQWVIDHDQSIDVRYFLLVVDWNFDTL